MNIKHCPLWSGKLQWVLYEGFHFILLSKLYMDTSMRCEYTAQCSEKKRSVPLNLDHFQKYTGCF